MKRERAVILLGLAASVAAHAAVIAGVDAALTGWRSRRPALHTAKGEPVRVRLSAESEGAELFAHVDEALVEVKPTPDVWATPAPALGAVADPLDVFSPPAPGAAPPDAFARTQPPADTAPPLRPLQTPPPQTPPMAPLERVSLPANPPPPPPTSQAPASAPPRPVGVASGVETVHRVEPIYPEQSVRRGHQGTVVVRVEVLASGEVGSVRVVQSSGHAALDSAAAKAARRSRFKPALRGGVPVADAVEIPWVFELK